MSKKKNRRLSRRSRRKLKRCLATGLLFLILLLLVFLGSCTIKKIKQTASKATSASVKQDNSDEKTEEPVITATPTPTPIPDVTLTVSVVGDCTLGTDENFYYDTSLNAYYDSYGKDYFLENVRDIFSSDDLTIANLEGTLTDSTSRADKLYAFKAPQEFIGILSGSSVEAVNMANNHSHDYGDQSFTDTLNAVDSAGITHFGYEETAVIEVKGVKVGLVGIYELYDHLERTTQLKEHIAAVKKQGAQLIIVIFHWGNEKETVPDSNQTTLGRLAIDEGADLVCGHHLHVLQGIETYKGKKIVYSLGNFCFGGNSAPSDMDSMIFQQTFTITADGVKADDVTNIIPCSISSAYGYNNYQPTPASGEEATRILNKIEERSSWIALPTVTPEETSNHAASESDNNTSGQSLDDSQSYSYDLISLP